MGRIAFFVLIILGLHGRASAYWQQHVSYDIHATLIDSIHTLDGTLSVVYTNNSPDTLLEVFFHLYANAFQPGSMMDERGMAINSAPIFDNIHKLPKSEWGIYWIDHVAADNASARFEITGTIMRIALDKPLAPGGSRKISFPFREQIPKQIRRSGWMSREHVEYSMSQWYPKICEYDQEGWHHQEYIAREFYGVWGEFNVELTLPSKFTVGSTGQCENPKEVGHGYDQIASGEKQGIFFDATKPTGMTTWKFQASNVHDFAWVADDRYIHEWTTWRDSITVHAFYKTSVDTWWRAKALEYSIHALKTYSELYGNYPYRNFSCTMAGDGGMEYPQLIMITGYRPTPLSLAGVIAHEAAHQWFYGMLGSNETREAFMDEGFTTYATTIAMNRLFGDDQQYPGEQHSWLDWFIPKFSNKRDNYRGYQQIASQGFEEPLDIPHDWFREDATAGQVYGKTAAILNMLEYTLGDSVFAVGMKNYFVEWHFKHPHLLDFKRVMEKTAHTDLNWFFDEWFKTTRTVDYEACSVKSEAIGSGSSTTVSLHNNSLAVMPIDILMHYDDGTSESATIPLATNQHLDYHKDGVSLFFPSWDWTAPNYTGTINTPKPVSWFEIDTSWRLQDLNWLNNYSGMPSGDWTVWKQLFINPPIDKYYAIARPIIWPDNLSWLNAGLGIKYGMNNGFSGDMKLIYKSRPGETDDNMNVPWYNYVDGALTYSSPLDWLGRLTNLDLDAEKMYGVSTVRASLTKVFRPEYWKLGGTQSASLFIEDQRLMSVDDYPVWHQGWGNYIDYLNPVNGSELLHTDVAGLNYSFVSERSNTHFDLRSETGIGSYPWFARTEATLVNTFPISSLVNARLRLAAGDATSYTPYQRQFWLDRAGNYEEQSNGFYRAVSSINETASQKSSMFLDGGAGVRGYNAGNALKNIYGNQMAGVNLDLNLPNPLANVWGFSSLAPGLFADAGWIENDTIRADAGIKIAVNILSWLPSQLRGVADEYDKIPTIYVDFPLFESNPLDGKSNFAFRWAISLGAAF